MPAPASRRPRFKSARAYVISLHTMLFRVNVQKNTELFEAVTSAGEAGRLVAGV